MHRRERPLLRARTWTTLDVDTTLPYSVAWPIPADGIRLLAYAPSTTPGGRRPTVPVTIDRTAPDRRVTSPAAGANLRGAAVRRGLRERPGPRLASSSSSSSARRRRRRVHHVLRFDSTPRTPAASTRPALADGLYDLRTFTSDVSGNSTASRASRVRIDNTLPTGNVTAPAAGRERPRHGGADERLGRRRLRRRDRAVPALPGRRGHLDEPGRDVRHDRGRRRPLRPPRRDDRQRRQLVHLGAATSARRQHAPDRLGHEPGRGGADVRGSITLASDSADAGSGVATVQFQRSPVGAAPGRTRPRAGTRTLQTDGQYDVRVVTTDNAGNAFTSPAITIRVDNTAPDRLGHESAAGAEVGVAPVWLTSDSADVGGSGVSDGRLRAQPAGANTWTATAASWNTASGPDAVTDGSYDLRVTTTDKAGNSFTSAAVTVLVDHTAPTTRVTRAGQPEQRAGHGQLHGRRRQRLRCEHDVVPRRRRHRAAGLLGDRPAPGDHSNDGKHVVQFFSTDDVGNVETPQDGQRPDRHDGAERHAGRSGQLPPRHRQPHLLDRGGRRQLGAVPVLARLGRRVVEHRRGRRRAAVHGLLDDHARRRRPYDLRAVVTDATGNVANELLPGLPKTVDNTTPSRLRHVARSRAVRLGQRQRDCDRDRRRRAARLGRVGRALRGQAVRGRLVHRLRHTDRSGLRLDLRAAAGHAARSPTARPTCRSSSPTSPATRRRPQPGRSTSTTSHRPSPSTIPGGRRCERQSERHLVRRHDGRDLPLPPGRQRRRRHADRLRRHAPFTATWTTSPAAEQQWELIAVATDGGGNVSTSAPRVVLVDRTLPTGSVTAPERRHRRRPGSGAHGKRRRPLRLRRHARSNGRSGSSAPARSTPVASDTSAPYDGTWNATGAPGRRDRNPRRDHRRRRQHARPPSPVTVDSTGPSVTLADPGAFVSGTWR